MKEFPTQIREAMRSKDIAATCIPVKLDGNEWEASLFFCVSGAECKNDRRILKTARSPTPVSLEVELMSHANAAVVVMRSKIQTVVEDPLVFEILLAPGDAGTHYECIKLLATQHRLCWFFADADFRVLQAQEQEIEKEQHDRFENLAREAFAHDSLIRMSGKYDARIALNEIVSHYMLRMGANPGSKTH